MRPSPQRDRATEAVLANPHRPDAVIASDINVPRVTVWRARRSLEVAGLAPAAAGLQPGAVHDGAGQPAVVVDLQGPHRAGGCGPDVRWLPGPGALPARPERASLPCPSTGTVMSPESHYVVAFVPLRLSGSASVGSSQAARNRLIVTQASRGLTENA